MAAYEKLKLSSSTNGRGIKIIATATAGTAIHSAHATAYDEVFLWAWNSSADIQLLTIEFGGVTDPDDIIEQPILPQDGLELVVPGLVATGSVAIAAFAETTNVVVITGYVNRITV